MFARATVAIAVAFAAACADASSAPTSSATSTSPSQSAAPAAHSANQGFAFDGVASGAPTGAVRLNGGGSFDATTASNVVPTDTRVHAGGGFHCLETVAQGPLNGCHAGEGVRWDAVQLLSSANFRCSAADAVKTAVTGAGRVALRADFHRAGDGNDASFTAQIVVSDTDIAPDVDGVQTLWIQGIGCATATAHFSH